MANYRWRDDERRWNESQYGRSGSSSGGWGQRETGRDPYRSESYESGDYAQGNYPSNQRRSRDEDYGAAFEAQEPRQRYGEQYRGDYDYGRAPSGSGYGTGSNWESGSSGYGYDPHSRQGQDWRGQGSGYRSREGSYGGGYGGDWNQNRGWWDRTRDEMRSWMGDDDAERRRRMDEMRQQSHYGRGPRGFTRSDERIREDVCERLTYDWSVDASDIEVNVNKGEVTLTGSVESRHSKRRTEDLVDDVPGVRHVQNNLRVKEAPEGTMGATTSVAGTGTGTTARPTH